MGLSLILESLSVLPVEGKRMDVIDVLLDCGLRYALVRSYLRDYPHYTPPDFVGVGTHNAVLNYSRLRCLEVKAGYAWAISTTFYAGDGLSPMYVSGLDLENISGEEVLMISNHFRDLVVVNTSPGCAHVFERVASCHSIMSSVSRYVSLAQRVCDIIGEVGLSAWLDRIGTCDSPGSIMDVAVRIQKEVSHGYKLDIRHFGKSITANGLYLGLGFNQFFRIVGAGGDE